MITAHHIARMLRIMLVLASVWLAALPVSHASAQSAGGTTAPKGTPENGELKAMDINGAQVPCRSYPEAQGGVMLGVIVPCLTRTVESGTMRFSQQLIYALNPLLGAFITFVAVLFGVKLLTMGAQFGGERQLKKEGFTLLLKIAFVIGMLQMVPSFWVPAAYDMMSESQSIVANTIGNGTSIHCPVASYGNGSTPVVWKQMDCVLGKLYGITTSGSDGKPSMLLLASGFGFASGFLFGGSFGIAVFVMLMGVLWTLVRIVIRTATAFMTGYLYVCVMLILSPIFMPLILLKPTEQYFQRWWSNILGSMLVPVIITAYAMIALQLYDAILFAPNSEITKLFDPVFAEKVKQAPPLQMDCAHLGNPGGRAAATGRPEKDIDKSKLLHEFLPGMGGGNNPCSALKVPQLEMTKEEFSKMFDSLVTLFITSLLISEGFSAVQKMAAKLAGSVSASGIASGGGLERKLDTALSGDKNRGILGARGELEKTLGNKRDTAFTKALVDDAPKAVTKGFIEGIRK